MHYLLIILIIYLTIFINDINYLFNDNLNIFI